MNYLYKFYNNGEEFISEFSDTIKENPLELSFFKLNAKFITSCDKDNFIIKIKKGELFLIALKREPYNLLIYGDKALAKYLAEILYKANIYVSSVLGKPKLINKFLSAYAKYEGISYKQTIDMRMMRLYKLKYSPKRKVSNASLDDIDEIYEMNKSFEKEALGYVCTNIDNIRNNISNYYIIRENDTIVSMAKETSKMDESEAISAVYTKPDYRMRGYAKDVVSAIAKIILDKGKTPYLYVDNKNPISNKVYKQIGFKYFVYQSEYKIENPRALSLVLAGGCFWCLANKFYNVDGIIDCISGYATGSLVMPSYGEVKEGSTGHKEAILIHYNPNIISYKEILDIYFDSIDPFDFDGQFIDKGSNYTCAIISSSSEVISYANEKIKVLEDLNKKKVAVEILNDSIFYIAEDEHQNYSLNHPLEFKEELIESKRINEELSTKEKKKLSKITKKNKRKNAKYLKKQKHKALNEPPKLSVLEEIGNSITHGVGAVLALVGLALLLLKSDSALKITASIVYSLSMFIMMLASSLYHAFRAGSNVKRVFRRFDYSSIYLLIGGTFAPLLLVYKGDLVGIVWFIIQWVVIITGITMVGVFGPGRLKLLHFPLYFILGWTGLFLVPEMINNNINLFYWILAGGLVYTLGMIPFVKRGVKSAHFIWHFFVLAGAIIHFIGILLCVY